MIPDWVLSGMLFFRAYNAYAFLYDFVFAYAVYTAFFELEGLSHAAIGGLLAVWSGSALVFEVGTGALSDRFDRRIQLVVAPLIKCLTFGCWFIADGSFFWYTLGFSCWSLGSSLYSGTGEALLYEHAVDCGREEEFDAIYGKATAAESVGIGAGYLFGGFIAAAFTMEHTLLWSIPPLLLCSLTGLFLKDIRTDDKAKRGSIFDQFVFAKDDFRANPALRLLTFYIAGALITFDELEEFDQLFYTAVDLPVSLFGIAATVSLAVYAFASVHAHRFANQKWMAWGGIAIGGCCFIAASFAESAWMVIVLELGYFAVIIPYILSEARFQTLIDSGARATTTSVLSFLQNVTALIFALFFGWLSNTLGILPGYFWVGCGLLAVAVIVFVSQRRSPIF